MTKKMDGPVVLGAFADTLVLNVLPTDPEFAVERRELRAELCEELHGYKFLAQERDEEVPLPYAFAGVPLLMMPTGGKGFFWIVKNTKITIAISRNAKRAMFAQVRLSSEYLWAVRDLGAVISDVHTFLSSFLDPYIVLQPSALDLTVDLLHLDWGLLQNIKQYFVTRAQVDGQHVPEAGEVVMNGPDALYERWGRLTGFSFGARASAVSATVYDKAHRIKYKEPEKAWFYDLWRHRCEALGIEYDEGMQVWRVEMRLRREALNELYQKDVFHGIDGAYELIERLPTIWAYLVGHAGGGADGLPDGWLRYVEPSEDRNRARWPVHPAWEVIQRAFEPEPDEETPFEQEERQRLAEEEGLLQEVDAELAAHPFQDQETLVRCRRGQKHALCVPEAAAVLDLRPVIRKRKRQKNTRRMIEQLTGCFVTLEAWRGTPEPGSGPGIEADLSDTVHYGYKLMQGYLEEKDRDFSEAVAKKRVLYSVETAA
jgi:hypothetical protein